MMRFVRPVPLATRPTVSVVVPCYNYGHFLPDAVSSATNQEGVDVDVLVVDDASIDGSGAVAHRIARRDPRVRVLEHATNQGHLRTYNDGLQAVDGDYVVLLSADDMLAPGALERATALLEAHPGVGFAYGYASMFEGAMPRHRDHVRNWSLWHGSDWVSRLSRSGRNVVVNPEVVMRREILHRVGGGYDHRLPHSADMYMWLCAARISDVGRINGATQAFYRVHGDNMHLTDFAGAITDLRERLKTWDQLFAGSADQAGTARLHNFARRGLSRQAVEFATDAYDSGQADPASFRELCVFASTAWPGITDTITWRTLMRRDGTHHPARWMRTSRHIRIVRHKARWRRWRRYGV